MSSNHRHSANGSATGCSPLAPQAGGGSDSDSERRQQSGPGGSSSSSEDSEIEDWELWADPREVARRKAERARAKVRKGRRLVGSGAPVGHRLTDYDLCAMTRCLSPLLS